MSNLQDLLAQKAEIEKMIIETQRSERAAAIAKIRAMMAEYGVSAEDLGGRSGGVAKTGGGSRGAGKKAAVKYRDQNGNTWSGRGLQPTWLRQAIEGGAQLEQFLVA